MKKLLMKFLACPECGAHPLDLTITEEQNGEIIVGTITCPQCNREYPIIESIPELMPDKLKGWYVNEGSPEAYDKHFGAWNPKTKYQQNNPWPFKRVIAKKAKGFILDAGCGPGSLGKYLRNTIFLDFSSDVLKKLWVGKPRPRVRGDVENMPFKNGLFDTVIATEVIEHTDNPLRFVEEVNRVLKDSGQFLFSFPWSDVSPTHKWKKITKDTIHSWISPSFTNYVFDSPPLRKERGMVYATK